MSGVIRIFVEKRDGFNVLAKQTLWDIRHNLGMKNVTDLRYIMRYDIEGLSLDEYNAAKGTILSEPNADVIYEETLPVEDGWKVFAMEYLPGQYDQRGDSAEQCVQLLTQGERCKVLTARVVAVTGDISDDDLKKIEDYLINPVESRLASLEKPQTLDIATPVPADVKRVEGFIKFNDEEMEKYYGSMGFAMTLSDLKFCRDYFRDTEKRDPSVTELRVIDTYWSDHCRHTTFLTKLEKIEVEKAALGSVIEDALNEYYATRDEVYGKDTKRIVSLMDMALIGMKSLKKKGLIPDLDESEEINACSIEVPVTIDGKTEQWLVQFKNETHNHPTEIEPFGGAATCLGGAIRDPLSGRSYVYQAMRVTGSGDPTIPVKDTMPGKLPSRKITTGAANGYSSYGNQIGLATGQVTELYDSGYVAKRLEIGAVIGASPKENVIREVPLPDDIIVLLGGRTGRDGCGGATGSSKAHTESSIETCGAEVQKGNPPTERKIQRLFRNPRVAKLIKRCNDFGAGGVCVAIGELADGLAVDLDKVTKKYDGLDGTELAISESQERMAVVLDKKDVETFIAEAEKENLEATAVAVVTESPRLTMTWRGDKIVDLSREFLNTNGVTQLSSAYITAPKAEDCYRNACPAVLKDMPADKALEENMARLEVCSQIGLSERFDASIGAATVIMPFGGKNQLTPQEAMAAKIPLEKGETDDATAMSYGFIPGVSRWSPFHGSAYAVVESLSKLLAIGANPLTARLTFQEYFERLKDVPERWGKPAAALLGAMEAQLRLGIPSIGGKDSMSGTFETIDVPPTLVSFAVAMTKASKTVSAEFKDYVVQWENVSVCSSSLSFEAYKRGECCYKSAHNRTSPCENCVLGKVLASRQMEKIKFHSENNRIVEILATPVFGEGEEIDGIVIRVDDITDRERMIEELRQAKLLAEQSDKLKSAFLANMSHEIRTPLNAIVGFSDLLMNSEEQADREEYMQIINTNNELLLKLINDILDLSKLESGSVELKYEDFDLVEYFNGMASSMKQRIVNPEVRLVTINPYDVCLVKLDRNRVAQVMTNYVTNAIKYTPKGSIEMGYEVMDTGIRLYVKDTGIGIPEEKKNKVFHRFEKLDEFAQGTGLGLSICKAITESMGGSVGFESKYHEGSLFWAIIPCNPEVKTGRELERHIGPSIDEENMTYGRNLNAALDRKTILIAEDISSNYLLLSAMLCKHYNLLHAMNGQQAVEMAKNYRIDLLLMDMKMPVMDGLTATVEIRKFNKELPIVALTAHAFDSDRAAALEAGCNDYLAKPVDKARLMSVLRKYCYSPDVAL